jgi:hypothetical protein
MSTVNLSPSTLVPKTGLYYCTTCKNIPESIRVVSSEAGFDPSIVERALEAHGVGANAPVTRKRFKAGDKFGVCPRHKTSTGWTLEKEEITTGKQWWQLWK